MKMFQKLIHDLINFSKLGRENFMYIRREVKLKADALKSYKEKGRSNGGRQFYPSFRRVSLELNLHTINAESEDDKLRRIAQKRTTLMFFLVLNLLILGWLLLPAGYHNTENWQLKLRKKLATETAQETGKLKLCKKLKN